MYFSGFGFFYRSVVVIFYFELVSDLGLCYKEFFCLGLCYKAYWR